MHLIFGAALCSAGLMVILAFGELATLNCDRIKPTKIACELTKSSLLGKDVTAIKEIQGAELERGARILLIADGKRIPLTEIYNYSEGEEERLKNKVNRINAFINNPEELSLKVQQDFRLVSYLIGGVFLVIGVLITLYALLNKYSILCFFDKGSGRMYLKRQNLLFQSDSREERLDAIREARVQLGSKNKKSYTELLGTSGATIFLGSLNNNVQVVQTINQFLNS